MSTTRRLGAEDSATRTALLDAAQHLLLEEGYAAVTSRRVGARAGLKPQLVHYYFRTMDDLFLALVRRGAEQNLERQARALASPHPLRALWEFSSDPAGTTLMVELFALANHRKAIRAELAAYAARFRRLQSEALATILERHGVDADAFPPAAMAVLMTAVAQILVMEEALGLTDGHAEMRALVERYLAVTRTARTDLPPNGNDTLATSELTSSSHFAEGAGGARRTTRGRRRRPSPTRGPRPRSGGPVATATVRAGLGRVDVRDAGGDDRPAVTATTRALRWPGTAGGAQDAALAV